MYYVKVLHDSDTALGIVGAGLTAPWSGGKYIPTTGKDGLVQEEIELVLDGTDTAISDAESALGRWLEDAKDDFHRVYLEIKTVSTGAAWRSRVMSGWIEDYPRLGGTLRGHNSEKVILHVTRLDEWEGAETALVLGNNRVVPHTTTGEIVNHTDGDAGDYNYLVVGAGIIPGDLPARCRLEVTNKNALANIGSLYVNLNAHDAYVSQLEAESAASAVGTPTADANCSAGNYNALSWATAGETTLLAWTLTGSAILNALKGREVRPLVKLRASAAYTDLLLKVIVSWAGTVLYSGPWAGFVPGYSIQRLPAVVIPPGVMGHAGSYADLTFSLVGWQPGAVAKALDVDFMLLMPLDGERLLRAPVGLGVNQVLKDDGMLPGLWMEVSGAKLPAFAGYGARLELPPAVGFSLWFLHETTAGVSGIAHQCEVKLWYRARKRVV